MPDEPFSNPFASLAHLRGNLPAGPPEVEAEAADAGAKAVHARRAVVRLERSGRGAKLVTVVDHLGVDAPTLGAWLKMLKTTLGCGGTVEGDAIVLQGDHRGRLPALLTAQGVRKVTVG